MKLDDYKNFKSGFVAIVGAPNVGKSTLLNHMLGQKISITSKKPQTTRNRILGVLDRPGSQFVFLDTPGVHHASKPLNVRIVEVALSALADVDLILVMADAMSPQPEAVQLMAKKLRSRSTPAILALNKIDKVEKADLLAQIDRWSQQYEFRSIVPVSALRGHQVDELVDAMETGNRAGGEEILRQLREELEMMQERHRSLLCAAPDVRFQAKI